MLQRVPESRSLPTRSVLLSQVSVFFRGRRSANQGWVSGELVGATNQARFFAFAVSIGPFLRDKWGEHPLDAENRFTRFDAVLHFTGFYLCGPVSQISAGRLMSGQAARFSRW